jgi:hypothetical protein
MERFHFSPIFAFLTSTGTVKCLFCDFCRRVWGSVYKDSLFGDSWITLVYAVVDNAAKISELTFLMPINASIIFPEPTARSAVPGVSPGRGY